jgi:ribonuclease P/MRP protein subunit RPP40
VVFGKHVSDWESVTSGVPQGSVLGLILFVIYINDMPSANQHFSCKLYADDSKIIAEIKNTNDSLKLQRDIDSIVAWTDKWLMRLNYDKCKVMHMGKSNPQHRYFINDYSHSTLHELTPTTSKRYLGIIISADAKWHNHASTIASKANTVLGWFKSSFMSREPNLWKKLYSTYIRPHLEFAAPAWNLYSKQDIDRVEKVQRRATKVSHHLKQFSYVK